MADLQIRFFGTAQMQGADNNNIRLQARKHLALLSYLLVENSQRHSRDSLMALLWPDFDTNTARNNFRVLLSALRKLTKDQPDSTPLILTTRRDVAIHPDIDIWIDVAEFEQLISRTHSHSHTHRSDCATCQPLLEQAVALNQDEFLAGFGLDSCSVFEEWLFLQREHYHLLAIEAHADLSTFAEKNGDSDKALIHARAQIKLDNLREPAYRQQMRILMKRGERSLALAVYERCAAILESELGVEPEIETLNLYEQILDIHEGHSPQDIQREQQSSTDKPIEATKTQMQSFLTSASLPAVLTSLVGREREVKTVIEMLQNQSVSLVNLIGLGGAGKTQLALAVARQLEPQFKNGACFVQLAPIEKDKTLLLSAVARAFSLPVGVGDEPAEPLLTHLASQELLLVLDNYEHLVDETELLTQIQHYAPGVTLLLTSRVRLNLVSEVTYVVTGLELPPVDWYPAVHKPSSAYETSSAIPIVRPTYGAVELFIRITKRLQPDFALGANNAAAIARICHLVAGSPLGLELAAAWTRILSCQEIAEELENNLDILATNATDRPERQRNMRHVFEYSWTMLSDKEKLALMRLTLFHGGFDRAAAQSVAQTPLTILAALMDKSLLQRIVPERYILHELVRQFVLEKVADLEDASRAEENNTNKLNNINKFVYSDLADIHAAYYLGQLHELGEALNGPKGKEWLPKLRLDDENIQRAWRHAVLDGPIEMLKANVNSAMPYYWVNGRSSEISQMLGAAIERIENHMEFCSLENVDLNVLEKNAALQTQIEVLIWLTIERALTFNHHGLYHDGIELVQPTIRIAEFLNLPDILISAYIAWGGALLYLSNPAAVEPLLKGQDIAQSADLPEREATLLGMLGICYYKQNQFDEAYGCYEQALALARRLKNWREECLNLVSMGWLLERMGEFVRAQGMHEQGLAICERMDYPSGVSRALQGLGTVAIAMGNLYDADQMHVRAIQLGQQLKDPQREAANRYFLGRVAFLSGDEDKARYNLATAIDIAQEIDDHLTEAVALAHLGYVETRWGSDAKAQIHLEQALSIGQRLDNTEILFMSYHGLGWLMLQKKQPAAAAEQFERELQLMQQWQRPFATIDAQTGLAQAALDQGLIEQAEELCKPLLAFLETGQLFGTIRIVNTFWVCYQLHLVKQPQKAVRAVKDAHRTLHEIASNFPNERQRNSFLHNIPIHHKICTIIDQANGAEPLIDSKLAADIASVLR